MEFTEENSEFELDFGEIMEGGEVTGVSSVNGYTGDVVLSAQDVGAATPAQVAQAKADSQTYTDEKVAAVKEAVEAEISTINSKIPAEASVSNQLADKTFVSGLVSDEASARELADTNLQGQIDAITSASDVVDVVGTYSELQAYDTQHLKDNDIVKVLVDETHDNAITYYRWTHSTTPYSWIYIGSQGPFYTKAESDTLLNEKADKSNTYTKTEVDTALAGKVDKVAGKGLSTNDFTTEEKTKLAGLENTVLESTTGQSTTAGMTQKAITDAIDNIENVNDYVIKGAGAPTTSTVGTVGKLYEDTTNGDLYQCTAVSGSTYTWEAVGGGGGGVNVVQTTGTSTTDVMSQKATSDMVYLNGAKDKIVIGQNATNTNSWTGNIAIGSGAQAWNGYAGTIAIGESAVAGKTTNTSGSIAMGRNAGANASWSVAIGGQSKATTQGEFSIGNPTSTDLYNGTGYRLLTNVHDGENAHDAMTVGQANALIDAINAALSTNIAHIGASA